MWDVVMLVLGLGLFAAGYAYACERLNLTRFLHANRYSLRSKTL